MAAAGPGHRRQLGEHNIWGKHTNFELGARVPLLFHAAGQTAGIKANALVESVDIYPTLAALAGLPPPPDLDGTDLSPLWHTPNATLGEAAFSECEQRDRSGPPPIPLSPSLAPSSATPLMAHGNASSAPAARSAHVSSPPVRRPPGAPHLRPSTVCAWLTRFRLPSLSPGRPPAPCMSRRSLPRRPAVRPTQRGVDPRARAHHAAVVRQHCPGQLHLHGVLGPD